MLVVLRRRNYGLLWTAQLISMIGDWALFTALPFFVYELTGSVLATGVMFMIQVMPPLILGSVAGVFVDRWDRRWTMIGASLFRGAVLLILLSVRSSDMIWLVYLAGFLESTATQFFGPANNALMPRLVDQDQLLTANSLDSMGENSARLIGPALGGAMLAALGLQGVIVFDIATYLFAAVLMFLITVPTDMDLDGPAIAETAGNALSEFWHDLTSGFRFVGSKPALSRLFLVLGIAMLGDSILTVLLVAFFQEVVGVGSTEFGIVLTVRGLAGIIGGVAMGAIGSRLKPYFLISMGLFFSGLGIITLVLFPIYVVSLLIIILMSVPIMAWLISSQTWIQTHSPDKFRGRVFGVYGTFSAMLMLIGMAFASGLGDTLGISTTLYAGGGTYVFAGVLALALLRTINVPQGEAAEAQAGE